MKDEHNSTSILVSVLLAVRDGEPYIHEAVQSIVQQTYKNWELIVIDDGSTDNTAEIVKSFNDSRIRLFQQQNQGLASSLNRAAGLAKGELLIRQDADDISSIERFEKIVDIYKANKTVALIATGAVIIDETGEPLIEKKIVKDKSDALKLICKIQNPFVHGSLAFTKQVYIACKGYDERFPTSQDFDFVVRLLSKGDLFVISEPLYKFRLHSESITAKKSWRQVTYLPSFCDTIKTNLALSVSYKIRFEYGLKRLLLMLVLAPANRKSIYDYQIGCLYQQVGDTSKSTEKYYESLRKSPMNFLSLIKIVKQLWNSKFKQVDRNDYQ